MLIQHLLSGDEKSSFIEPASDKDFTLLTEHRYFFDWKVYKHTSGAYVLRLEEGPDILGVMTLIPDNDEQRIEVELLSSSRENTGRHKVYDRIPGCLLAFACYQCFLDHREEACVSLVPKTLLRQHYKTKYGMVDRGPRVALEGPALMAIINQYLFKHGKTTKEETEAG